LELRLLGGELSIVRLPADAASPSWLRFASGPLVSVTHTVHELSIVCPSAVVPPGLDCEPGWRAFQVEGKLAFSATAILTSILNPLADAGISIFAISTFDTDYVLVRAAVLEPARAVLGEHFALVE
jgi:uncharacterized protein